MSYNAMLLLVSATCILASCTQDDLSAPSDSNMISVKFKLETPSAENSASTYAIDVEDEWSINEIDVLAFKLNEGDGNEYFAYKIRPGNITGTGNTKEFTVNLVKSDDQYRFVILANVRQEVNALGNIATTDTRENVLARLIVEDPVNPFPMWGESEPAAIGDETDFDDILMIRTVARIDVEVDGSVDNFSLTGVYLYNRNTRGHIVPDPAYWDDINNKVLQPTVPADPGKEQGPLSYTESPFVRGIYTFEAAADPGNLTLTPCIVVGGLFGTSTEITYYRVDFKDNLDNYLPLLRNHLHAFTITSVSGPGPATPDEAFASRQFNITADIAVWNETETTGQLGNYTLQAELDVFNITRSGYSGTTSVLTNHPDGWTATVGTDASSWLTITGATTGAANTEANMDFSATSIDSASQNRTGIILLTAGNLTKNIYVTQTYEADADTTFANSFIVSPLSSVYIPVFPVYAIWDDEGLGTISGTLTAELVWKDTPGPLSLTNTIQGISLVNGDRGAASVIRVRTGSMHGNAVIALKVDGTIRWSWHIWVTEYNPNSAEAGSATGVYGVANGNVHRFITAFSVNNVFMDRNLGALTNNTGDINSRGLLYQWGRLSPLPGSKATTQDDTTEPETFDATGANVSLSNISGTAGGSLVDALANPFRFYGNTVASDWFTDSSTKRVNWWCNADGSKGVYDPCPDGWRVPRFASGNTNNFVRTDSPWYLVDDTLPSSYGAGTWADGWNFQAPSYPLGYYPATGHRDEVSGALTNILNDGSFWSSSAYTGTTFRYYFHINPTYVGPIDYGNSNRGNNIRCVRDN